MSSHKPALSPINFSVTKALFNEAKEKFIRIQTNVAFLFTQARKEEF